MTDLPETVAREVLVPAPAEVVWRFLSTDEGWAAWWGAGSTIHAEPGGAMTIAYPDGQSAVGTVLAVTPLAEISFTYGYPRDRAPIPVDGSTVDITLHAAAGGTTVRVEHHVADATTRAAHEPGWRYQVGLFRGVVVAAARAGTLAATIDGWHAAWTVPDVDERRAALCTVVTDDVTVDEPMAALAGIDDLDAWIAQVQAQFAATVRRVGPPALCGSSATWDWEVVVPAGSGTAPGAEVPPAAAPAGGTDGVVVLATGRSVGRLAADGRLSAVTAFWLTAPPSIPTSLVQLP